MTDFVIRWDAPTTLGVARSWGFEADTVPLAGGGFVVTMPRMGRLEEARGDDSLLYVLDATGALVAETPLDPKIDRDDAEIEVVALADGGFAVAWTGRAISRTQAFDADGTPRGEVAKLDAEGLFTDIDVVATPEGYAVLTKGTVPIPGGADLWEDALGVTVLDRDGVPAGEPVRVYQGIDWVQSPALSAAPGGDLAIYWWSDAGTDPAFEGAEGPGSSQHMHHFVRLDAGGGIARTVVPPQEWREFGFPNGAAPMVMPLAGGGFSLLVNEGWIEGPPFFRLWSAVLDEDGTLVFPKALLDRSDEDAWPEHVGQTPLAGGGSMAAWIQQIPGVEGRLFLQRLDAEGETVGERLEFDLGGVGGVDGSSMSWLTNLGVDALPSGEIVVTWANDANAYANVGGPSSEVLRATTLRLIPVDEGEDGTGGDDVIAGSAEDDVVRAGEGADTVDGRAGDDVLRGQAGADLLLGGEGEDRLVGGGGADTLDGGAGDDEIRGKAGHDALRGGAGDDRIRGGGGDDVIEGGAGRDRVKGGEGADVFVLRAGDEHLRIRDFDPAEDEIRIEAWVTEASGVKGLIRDHGEVRDGDAVFEFDTGPGFGSLETTLRIDGIDDLDVLRGVMVLI